MSDNVLNTPGLMDPSTEFGSMMKHAMGIKSAQMEQDRKRFETWPTFLQNSMWERNEETLRLRELPVDERMEGAAALKEQGNEFFRNKQYASAVEHYEAAVGVYRYAKQLDPEWKSKGIKDDTIDLIDERGEEGSGLRAEVDAFCVSVYNNLSASYLARATGGRPEPGGTIDGDFRLCVQASTFGIEVGPTSKAYYRRARARCEPMTATDTDVESAIRDLTEAVALEPGDKAVRALLTKLKKGRSEAKAKDKGAMSGMFDKTELYDAKTLKAMAKREETARKLSDPSGNKPRTAEDAEKEAIEAEQAVAHLRERGRHEDAASLEKKIAAHRAQLEEFKEAKAESEENAKRHDPRFIDFSNPTDEQVADAKKHGIDLFDPMIVKELQRLQDEKGFDEEGEEGEEEGEEEYDDEDEADVGSGEGSAGDGARDEVPSIYRGKMNSRLQRMRERDADEQQGRRGRGRGRANAERSRQNNRAADGLTSNTKTTIMAIAFAIGIYRVWAMLSPVWAEKFGQGASPAEDLYDEGM